MVTASTARDGANSPALDEAVRATGLRNLYGAARNVVWANLVAVIAIVMVCYGHASNRLLFGWVVLIAIAVLARFTLLGWRTRRDDFGGRDGRDLLWFCLASGLLSGLFATGFLLLAPGLDDYRRALMLVALAAMCAGAAVSMSGHAKAYFSYALPMLLPTAAYSAWLATHGLGTVGLTETFIILSYLWCMLAVHARASAASNASLTLQMEKSALADELEAANQNLERDRDMFRTNALTDGLTGIPNRRQFDEMLIDEWRRAARGASVLGCLMVDIDHFKLFNDRYGHDAGDECLVRVASAIADVARRGGDHAARYGGEEFAVILPGTDMSGVAYVGNKIRAKVEALAIEHRDSPFGVVSLSLGAAAVIPTLDGDCGVLVKRADKALYCAKEGGRNRVSRDVLLEDPTLTELVDPRFARAQPITATGS